MVVWTTPSCPAPERRGHTHHRRAWPTVRLLPSHYMIESRARRPASRASRRAIVGMLRSASTTAATSAPCDIRPRRRVSRPVSLSRSSLAQAPGMVRHPWLRSNHPGTDVPPSQNVVEHNGFRAQLGRRKGCNPWTATSRLRWLRAPATKLSTIYQQLNPTQPASPEAGFARPGTTEVPLAWKSQRIRCIGA